jgi:uncharacterized surface protein with fasciclin (FAS1) repeats
MKGALDMNSKLIPVSLVVLLFALVGCEDEDNESGPNEFVTGGSAAPQAGTGPTGGTEPMAGTNGEAGIPDPGPAGAGGSSGVPGPTEPKDIVDTAVDAGDFSTLAAALTAAELIDALKQPGPFTVFAPTDAAFAELGAAVDDLLLPENKDNLIAVLSYHVIAADSAIMSSDLEDGALVSTLGGPPLAVDLSGAAPMINDAEVTTADIETSNGVIHVINKVLLPPSDDIVATAVNTENEFTLLEAALGAAELVTALQGEGPFTVFAPTDAAFQALGTTLDDLLKPENKDQLANILKYHVVSGRIAAADLSNGQQVETLFEGNSVTIDLSGETPKVDDANIVQTNILTTNGVIHVIDKVIIPAT